MCYSEIFNHYTEIFIYYTEISTANICFITIVKSLRFGFALKINNFESHFAQPAI